jgi:hypothetical protein
MINGSGGVRVTRGALSLFSKTSRRPRTVTPGIKRPQITMIIARTARATLRRVSNRAASTLLVADHSGDAIGPSTLNAVSAAQQIGGDITVLVAGTACEGAATAAAQIDGVTAVLHADDECLGHQVAENVTKVILAAQEAGSYTHILQAATNDGKNTLPRVAAALDVSPILDILTVESEDTFTRPMYAGNAIATVQSSDSVKVSSHSWCSSRSKMLDNLSFVLTNSPFPFLPFSFLFTAPLLMLFYFFNR